MEESKPGSIPVEHSRSIYHLIRENEPHSFTDDLGKNNKNGQNYFNTQCSAHGDDDNSYLFEETHQKIKTNITEHEEDERKQLETQYIPIAYPINDSQLSPIVPLLTDLGVTACNKAHDKAGESQVSIKSNTTTEWNDALESNAQSPEISNLQSIYFLDNNRLPMADLYSQYHVVSQHGYSTSTSSINTCDTRSSTPTFYSHPSNLTGTSDSDMYVDSEVDFNFGPRDELAEIKTDLRKKTAYGSYDLKSHSLDSNIECEDIMLTSFKDSDGVGAENNLKLTNIGEPKVHVQNLLTHETLLADPPLLPNSEPPRTPPMLQINGDNLTGTAQRNGNHVVQNMSNEMYKTMKQAIKPGKVNKLKKIFANFFDDHNIEDMFLPAEYQQNQKHSNIVDDFDSANYVITDDTQRDVSDSEASVEGNKTDTLKLTKDNYLEKGTERVDKENNLSYNEYCCQVPQIVKETLPIQVQEIEIKQEQEKTQNHQEQLLLEKLHTPVLKAESVQQLLPKTRKDLDYFTDVPELRSDSNSVLVYSTPDCLVTSSYTPNDHVSITNATTTKPTLVIMTPTVNKVSQGESNSVSKEIKPVLLAPPHLPAAKIETETIWKSEEGTGLMQRADLSRERESELVEESVKETEKKKEDKPVGKEKRDGERNAQEWKEEQYEINLNYICVAVEPAVVKKKEEEDKKEENWRAKVEEKVEEIRRNSENEEMKIRKVTEENIFYGQQNEAKHEKQFDKLEINVTKEIESFNERTTINNDGKLFSDKQELDLQQQNEAFTLLSGCQREKADVLAESLITKSEENPEDVKTESPPTCSIETSSFSLVTYCEALKTTATIGPATATTVSNKAPLVSDNPSSLLNSNNALVGYNNSSIVATIEKECMNHVAIPTRQTSDNQEILTTASHVVDLTSPIVSPAAVLLPFPSIKESNGLSSEDGSGNTQLEVNVVENNVKDSNCFSKLQPGIRNYEYHAKEVNNKYIENIGYGNDDGKENKEIKVIRAKEIEADESASQMTEVEVKHKNENEMENRNKEIKETIDGRITSSSEIRRSKSDVVRVKKEYPLPRAQSMHTSKMIPPTVQSAIASNKGIRGAIFPFKALRQMFEEGRPLKRDDYEKDPPSVIKAPIYPTNVHTANTEEAKSNLYPWAPHKEYYLSSKTPSPIAKGSDVYLSKQPATKINKSETTCITATTTTNRMSTANTVTTNLNQLSPNTSTTSSLSSATPDGWLGRTKNIEQNTKNISSSLHGNAVDSNNPGAAGFSISHSEEKDITLELSTTRKSDTDRIFKDNGHDSNSKGLHVAKTATLESDNRSLRSTRLNTLPLIFQDSQREELSTLKRNNINQSIMDPLNGNGNATVEKVSSFRIHTHLSETDNRARMEELILSSNTPDDYATEDNRYISQIGVNSAILVEEEPFAQNNCMHIGTNFVPVNSNHGSLVPENTTLTRNVSISTVNVLTPGISTIVTDVHLAPMQNVKLSNVNSGQVNILSTNEMTQTVIETAPPQLVNEVSMDRNIALNEATSTRAYSVGVDTTSQDTLFNNNESVTINSVSVSSPGIQYYSDSQSSTDTWQTAPNSTTLYTNLTPEATGLTSSDQCGLSSTTGILIPATVVMNAHHHHHHEQQQQQEMMEKDLMSSPTPSSVYVGNTGGTEKSRNETPVHIQRNVFRRIVEFEKSPEDHRLEKQIPHSFTSRQKAGLLVNEEEDAETTYEKVKRNLRPIPAKNDDYFDLNVSTMKNPDFPVDDCSQITDMSSLRSSQTPSYYSVNESITSFTEDDKEDHITDHVNSDHQYAVVRLTPSNTDFNKVKNTIYCQVGSDGIKTSSPNVMRQRSELSNASFSIPSTAASDTEDELSDANDARSDKQFLKKINRTAHKNIGSMTKLKATDTVETHSMKKNTYKTETNILLTTAQSPKGEDNRVYQSSEMAIDSGTGTEIISSEGEFETTETWYEYENIPYEKYEEISKNISMDTTVKSLRSTPPSSLSLSSIAKAAATTTTQYKERDKASLTKSDSSQIYKIHTEPETVSQEGEEDLRIVRGRLLIKNTIDSPKDGDDFDDNINVFADEFHLDKENPLYQSDPDIYKHTEEEEKEEKKTFMEEWPEDITFDQVDHMAKHQKSSAKVMKAEVKGKQNLSNLLLSRLSKIDSKDIKQSINVEHHHEEIYGDIDFVHADGTKASSDYTENFDSIAENVELLLKSGKAVILIKVIAERIIPIDYEFNVWRKSSAIVTRQIELDLLANEQRKRLYNHVMENSGVQHAIEPKKYGSYLERTQGREETVLNSQETFRLFNQLLTVAENNGEGGDQNEVYSEKTERLALQKPCISDFMY